MWVAVAVVGGALIGGVASTMASNKTAGAMESAANTQAGAAAYAANLQNEQWQQTQQNMKPWLQAGTGAINQLATGIQPGGKFAEFKMNPLMSDPSYAFRKQEGVNALMAQGAAGGNLASGNMGVALQNYGQNLASTEYQNEYARQLGEWMNSYNMLSGVAGTGQTAATNLGTFGANAATSMGESRMGGANALAAGQIGAANAQGQSIMNWGNQLQGLAGFGGNYMKEQNMLNAGWQNNLNSFNSNPYSYTNNYSGGSDFSAGMF